MEDKQQSEINSGMANSQPMGSGEQSAAPNLTVATSQQPQTGTVLGRLRLAGGMKLWGAVVVVLLLVGLLAVAVLAKYRSDASSQNASLTGVNGRYEAQKIDLSGVPSGAINLSTSQSLSINGQLRTNNSLILTPTDRPSEGTKGQIYFDKASDTPYIYDGQAFVAISTGESVRSLGGSAGEIVLGTGLMLQNGQLSLTQDVISAVGQTSAVGVTSLQGQTGAVNFTAGSGIAINGTTITNTGVRSIQAASPQLTVTSAGNGVFSIGTAGDLLTGTGTNGQIAIFTGTGVLADSILSQTGGSIVVSGDLQATGQLSANTISSLTTGQDFTISAGSDQLVLVSEGRTFQLPTGGAVNQTICTVGMDCSTGGGGAYVLLQPGTAQDDAGSGPSLFINNSGGGDLLRLQGNGLDRLVVSNGGNASFAGNVAVAGTINGATISGSTVNGAFISGGSLTSAAVNGLNVSGTAVSSTGSLSISSANNQNLSLNAFGSGVVSIGSAELQGTGALLVGAGGIDQDLTLSGSGIGSVAIMVPRFIGPNGATYTFNAADAGTVSATICTSVGNCLGAGGGVGGDGTAGTIAVFNGSGFTIGDSLLSQSAGTVTVTGDLAATNLQGNGGGVTNINAGNITVGVLSDGRLSNNVALYSAAVANFTGTLQQGGEDVCTMSGNCVGSGAGIGGNGTSGTIAVFNGSGYTLTDSLLSQSGTAVTVAGDLIASNLQGNGSAVTNVNAALLGGFASSYYLDAGNISAGTLDDGRLSVNVTMQGNTFNGANQLVQLNASGQLPAISGALLTNLNANSVVTGTLDDARLSANVALFDSVTANFTGTLQQGGNDVCTTAGNCVGSGGAIGGGGTAGVLPVFDGTGYTVSDSALSQAAGVVTVAGDLVATNLQGNGSAITDVNAAQLNGQAASYYLNASNIATGALADARLSVNVTLQGNAFNGAGQLVQLNGTAQLPALSGALLTDLVATNISAGTLADARLSPNVTVQGNVFNGADQLVQLNASGQLPALSGALLTNLNASSIATGTLDDGRLSANVALLDAATVNFTGTLQQAGSDVCTTAGNCVGSGGGALGGSGTAGTIAVFNGSGYTLADSILSQAGGVLSVSGSSTLSASGTDQSLTLQGTGTGGVIIKTPSFNNANGATYTFNASDGVGVNAVICTSQGNCIGSSGGAIGGSGTPGALAVFDGSGFTITDSILSESAGVVTVAGDLVASNLQGNGSAITDVNAAQLNGQAASYYMNASNINAGVLADARLSANVTVQGNTFNGASQLVQLNASGQLPALSGALLTNLDAGSIASGTLADGRLSANVALYDAPTANFSGNLQQAGFDVCTTAGNCVGSGGAGGAVGGSGTANTIAMFNGTGFTIGDSMLSQNALGTVLNVSGQLTATNGIAVTGNSTIIGTLSSLTGLTSTGTITGDNFNAASGGYETGGTLRLGNTGDLQNITGFIQTSGNFSHNGTGNFSTGTGSIFLNGSTAINSTLNVSGATTFENYLTINGGQFTNGGSTLNTTHTLSDFATDGPIGIAGSTVDRFTGIAIPQTTVGVTLTMPSPTTTTAGRVMYIMNTGSTDFAMHGAIVSAGSGQIYMWNGTAWILGANGGGSSITLQGAFDGGNTLNTTDARNIAFTLSNTTTDANFITNIASGSTGQFKIQNNGSDILTMGSAGQLGLSVQGAGGGISIGGDTALYRSGANRAQMSNALTLRNTTDTATAFQVQTAAGVDVLTVDTITKTVGASNLMVGASGSLTITGGATGTRPVSPTEGMVYFDTTTKQLLVYANGKWQADRSSSTIVVAANNSKNKDAADFVVTSADETAGNADAAINAAIAALPAGGGTIYLMEGTYTIDSTLTIWNNTTLAGSGNGSTIIKLKDASNVSIDMVSMYNTFYKTNITVRDLQIDGNSANQTAGTQIGIHTRRVGRASSSYDGMVGLIVEGVSVKNMRGHGIYLEQTANSRITNSYFTGNTGVGINDSSGGAGTANVISNNTVNTNTAQGIIAGGDNSTVSGNTVSSNGTSGIYISSSSAKVLGNTILTNTGYGVLVAADGAEVKDNTISGNTGNGILLDASGAQVDANEITSNGATGIYMDISEVDSRITNNTINSNTGNGIQGERANSNTTITGNTIKSNTAWGVYMFGYIYQAISNQTVNNNYVSSNASGGIQMWSVQESNIVGNTVSDNGGATDNNGILIANISGNINVSNNSINDTSCTTTCYAIDISGGVDIYLSNNTIGDAARGATLYGTFGYGLGEIRDNGINTIYANQRDAKGNLINRGGGAVGINTTTINSSLTLQGGLTNSQLPTPAQPTIARVGVAGTTTYGYRVTALDGTGETLPSTERTITNASAVLDGTNYNTVNWSQVSGAVQYKVYRTTSGGTPASLGLIATITGATNVTFNDTGIAATTAAPVANTTGGAVFASTIQGTTATLTGGVVTVGSATQQGSLVLYDGSSNTATIQVGNLAGNYTYAIPVTTGNDTFCMLLLANCGGGVGSLGALDGGTPSANGASIAGGILYLQSASGTNAGLVNTTAQTFAGDKTFTGILAVQDLTVGASKSLTITGGATGTRPASPTEGMVYFDTTTKQLITYANGKWQGDRTTSTKIVAMGTATGCSGSAPVASQNPDGADFVVTSCTSAQTTINNAINALPSGGGTVYLMEGTYIIDGEILPNNNVTIAGAGKATIIKFKDSIGVNTHAIYGISKSRLVIRDLKIDGNKANNTGLADNGIYMGSVGSGSGATAIPGVTINSVEIVNMAQYGIYMNSTINSTVTNSTVTASANTGIYMTSMTNNTIVNNNVLGSGGVGIYVLGGTGGNITSNIVEGSTSNGIQVASGSRIAVTGNSVKSSTDNGIQLAGSSISVTGNTIASNTDVGIYVQGTQHVISGNTIASNATHGIYLQTTTDNNITDNSIISNDGHGIYAWNSNVRNTITSNVIRDNGSTGSSNGIYITLLSNYNMIANNIISDTVGTGSAIYIAAEHTTLSNNTYSGTGATTISDTSTTTIYANQADANGNLMNRGAAGFSVNTATVTSSLTLQGGLTNSQLPTPAQPTVARVGTAGTTTYGYRVTALDGTGETLPSTERTITNANAVLNGTNYNTITWASVPGAVQYKVYRTTSAGTPASTGLIGTITGGTTLSFNDTGIAGTTVAPTNNSTGGATFASTLKANTASGFTGNLLDLQVNGSSKFSVTEAGNTSVGGTLTVTNGATFNGTMTVAGAVTLNSTLTVSGATTVASITVNGHIVSGGSAPTTTLGPAGCDNTILNIAGNDTAGKIYFAVTSFASCTVSGQMARITFASPFGDSPVVAITPANANAADLNAYVDNANVLTTYFDINTTQVLVPGETYIWHYHVIE